MERESFCYVYIRLLSLPALGYSVTEFAAASFFFFKSSKLTFQVENEMNIKGGLGS